MASDAPIEAPKPRDDSASWATPTGRLRVSEVPAGAINLNVAGRRLVGPVQGFGQLWQKTYRVRLDGVTVTPPDVIREWKANYASFWPKGNRFYAPRGGIRPGAVALINGESLGVDVSTGVEVIYADEESFTFMNAEGHPAAGIVTFSAARDEQGVSAQVQVLIRADDPFYDVMLPIYGHRAEDQIWTKTLGALAAHFGAHGDVTVDRICVDRRRNWSQAKNIWRNAAIRSGIWMAGAPVRWARRFGSRLGGRDGTRRR